MNILALERNHVKDFSLVILASLIISLSRFIAIPLWFTPVPMAIQNAVILLMAAHLGSKRGFLATLLFLFEGASGLPVFASGVTGIFAFVGPTGGYFWGYLVASFVVGYMIEKNRSPLLSFIVGNGLIFLCGASFLATFVGFEKAFLLGIAPFLLGDVLKIIVCTKILPWTKNVAL